MAGEKNPRALKHMFDAAFLRRLETGLKAAGMRFDARGLLPAMTKLELKDRVRLVRDHLHAQLPTPFPRSLQILIKAVEAADLRGFDLWPITEFVQTHGTEHPDLALTAMKRLTARFTAEWAVRPFIRQDPTATLAFLLTCARDEDEHVRRWASEGSRPRLPWGERLACVVRDPGLTLPILELLKDDEALYVRKSVANHLNDISKDHPEIVVKVLKQWLRGASVEVRVRREWIAARALRTLVKAGHPGALALFGARPAVGVSVEGLALARKRLRMGEDLVFTFTLRSAHARRQKLVVDYVMHFRRADGSLSPKVFKLRQLELGPREVAEITKRHPLRTITTRTYHAGPQKLQIQVNGEVLGTVEWHLRDGSPRK